MMGFSEEPNIRYLSQEKNNYDQLQDTILFTITDKGQVGRTGTSWKRDREYQLEHTVSTSKPKMDDCKEWVFNELAIAGGKIKTKELDEKAQAAGYSVKTYKAAKTEMKNEGLIDFRPVTVGTGRNAREWYTVIPTDMAELPNDTPTPFDEL